MAAALAVAALFLTDVPASISPPVSAAAYPNAAVLLQRSISSEQHSDHTVLGVGTIGTSAGHPGTKGLAHLTGDCVQRPPQLALRGAVIGTVLFGAVPAVPLAFHLILISARGAGRPHMWTRSPATHNTWQVATRSNFPTRYNDLVVYLCPAALGFEYAQHAPPNLRNLRPVVVQGRAAWHLQSRVAPTAGGFKGTVQQTDFFLARSSLRWLRFGSLYQQPSFTQQVSVDYEKRMAPISVTAPTIGSSFP